MGLVRFDDQDAHDSAHSTVTGTEFIRGDIHVYKVHFQEGDGAHKHAHPEEQFFYVLTGRVQITLDGETFEVNAGEAAYFPSNSEHESVALAESEALSFKAPARI